MRQTKQRTAESWVWHSQVSEPRDTMPTWLTKQVSTHCSDGLHLFRCFADCFCVTAAVRWFPSLEGVQEVSFPTRQFTIFHLHKPMEDCLLCAVINDHNIFWFSQKLRSTKTCVNHHFAEHLVPGLVPQPLYTPVHDFPDIFFGFFRNVSTTWPVETFCIDNVTLAFFTCLLHRPIFLRQLTV